ncbi:tesmin isoform X3 [Tamandua tetradactyla]|uniref:tesmin isoform X3 n=1 Tax=Tamandua tetradactyla TaxID=48850 RepID=UPI004053916D
MDEAALLDGLSGPEDDVVTDLFSPDSQLVPENRTLKSPAAVKHEEDKFPVYKDAFLSSADPKEPLLHAFNPPLNVDCKNNVKVELLVDDNDEEQILGEYPGLPELNPLEDAALLSAPPPPAYNVHFLSSLLTPHRSPAVVPLGAWAREGATHPGVRMIPVGIKEAGGTLTCNNPEQATFQNPHIQETCCKFSSSQEPEDTSTCSLKKDSNPMVICQLKGGTQMLCIDNSGTRELKALHLVPQYQDQNNYLQSDVPRPMTTLVGRFLPVPGKLNLIAQLDNGSLPSIVNGSTFPSASTLPGLPKITLAGYCDCFASGDFCNNCNCNNCCNNLQHEIERFKAIKEMGLFEDVLLVKMRPNRMRLGPTACWRLYERSPGEEQKLDVGGTQKRKEGPSPHVGEAKEPQGWPEGSKPPPLQDGEPINSSCYAIPSRAVCLSSWESKARLSFPERRLMGRVSGCWLQPYHVAAWACQAAGHTGWVCTWTRCHLSSAMGHQGSSGSGQVQGIGGADLSSQWTKCQRTCAEFYLLIFY